jgi:hypothetical protein
MKTAYLIKAVPMSINFHCDDTQGISFTTSYLDVTYLNNVIIDGVVRIFVQQKVYEEPKGVSKPQLWFLVFGDHNVSNENFEQTWQLTNQIGAHLYQYTQLGLRFSYREAWTYPNIPPSWKLEETLIQFNENDGVDGIYWDDPSQPTYEQEGEILRETTMISVKADLVAAVGSEERLTQSHFVHLTIPGTATNIDLSPFDQTNEVLDQIRANGFHSRSRYHTYVLQLFNRAITQEDMFVSCTVLFQMVETIVRLGEATKIESAALNRLRSFLKSDPDLEQFEDRIFGAVGAIKRETSLQLLKSGVEILLEKPIPTDIDCSEFPRWRNLRGSLTHPDDAAAISQNNFFDCYQSLRKFCTAVVNELHS